VKLLIPSAGVDGSNENLTLTSLSTYPTTQLHTTLTTATRKQQLRHPHSHSLKSSLVRQDGKTRALYNYCHR
jgi:hypothetical protein